MNLVVVYHVKYGTFFQVPYTHRIDGVDRQEMYTVSLFS